LYETDENWAQEGPNFVSQHFPELNQVLLILLQSIYFIFPFSKL